MLPTYSKNARDELRSHLDDAAPITQAKGARLLARHAISEITARPGSHVALVRDGDSTVEAGISFDHSWTLDCECSYPHEVCEHIYALGQWILEESSATVIDGAETIDIESAARERVGRELRKTELEYLGRIDEAWQLYLERGAATTPVLCLLRNVHPHRSSPNGKESCLLAAYMPGQAKNALELLGFATAYHLQNDTHVPAIAKEIVDLSHYQRELQRQMHAQSVIDWKRILNENARGSAPSAKNADPASTITLALALNRSSWQVKFRQGDSSYQSVSQAQLLDWEEFHPELLSLRAIAFLAIADEFLNSWKEEKIPLKAPYALQFAERLVKHPELRGCLIDKDDQPLPFHEQALHWSTTKSDGPSGSMAQLQLTQPDGNPLPYDALPLTPIRYDANAAPEGRTIFWIANKTLYSGPPPLNNSHSIELPWDAVASEPGIQFLKSSGSQLPEEIASRTRLIAPAFTLEAHIVLMAGRFGTVSTITATLQAHAADGQLSKTLTASGWTESSNETLSGSDADAIELLDLSEAPDLLTLFKTGPLRWKSEDKEWQQPIDERSLALSRFADWLHTLPPEIELNLGGELQNLREPPIELSWELDIQESKTRDWFDVKLIRKLSYNSLRPEEIDLLLANAGKYTELPGGKWRRLTVDIDPHTQAAAQRLGIQPDAEAQQLHTLHLDNDILRQRAPEALRRKIEAGVQRLSSLPNPEPPAQLAPLLRPYQTEGFQFLSRLGHLNFGGILADDMGLGKTLQTLTWLTQLSQTVPKNKLQVLIVCPKSVTDNWISEVTKFDTGLTAVAFKTRPSSEEAAAIAAANLVVANYAQLRSKADSFLAQHWSVVVLDEGQYIKNPSSQTARTAYELKADHRLVLTGTPIENRALDLWSLMRFATPGALGPQAQFKRLYNDKADPDALARLSRRVQPFILRRTKSQVAKDLPPRIEEELHCALEGDQAKLYKAELKKAQQLLLGVRSKTDFDKSRFNILQSLLRLRQICCDPQLITGEPSRTPSAKLQALLDLVQPLIDEGHKVLIFSQFVSVLEILETAFEKEKIPTLSLTGKTENRGALVKRFQQPETEQVFLLSLKAAGSGLNLTAASYVVLFDPWWNPAVEAQAIDRTHRIGQKSQVMAYRLIAKDTIEEKIRAMQNEKSNLASRVIDDQALSASLDLDTLRDLLADH